MVVLVPPPLRLLLPFKLGSDGAHPWLTMMSNSLSLLSEPLHWSAYRRATLWDGLDPKRSMYIIRAVLSMADVAGVHLKEGRGGKGRIG